MSIAFMDTAGKVLTIVLSKKQLQQFKEILARGLNTAPPEKYPDWLKLSDQLLADAERNLS